MMYHPNTDILELQALDRSGKVRLLAAAAPNMLLDVGFEYYVVAGQSLQVRNAAC